MAALLEASYYEFDYSGNWFMRSLILSFRTWSIIRKKKPDIVFYQNPSIVLAFVVTLTKALSFRKFCVVGDFHNAGVYPPVGRILIRIISRQSNLILVSNQNLVKVLESWGAKAMAFPDPIPSICAASPAKSIEGQKKIQVLFICSWAEDEPIEEVIKAGALLENAHILITGRPDLSRYPSAKHLHPNIKLLGFLSESDFDDLLYRVDIIIDLTTRDDCMVCGAYEGISAGKPLILSDNSPTRQYFSEGALFTDNSSTDIALKTKMAIKERKHLSAQIKNLRKRLIENDLYNKVRLMEMLSYVGCQ
jgi:glycosyltransferase involved in cell wall biosynthesis